MQEILVVGIGRRILRIDTTKVGKGEVYSAEEPLKCPVDKVIDGVQLVGNHDGEVTDLSMCQWMTTRLVSASVDGMVCIYLLLCCAFLTSKVYVTVCFESFTKMTVSYWIPYIQCDVSWHY